MTTRDRLVVLGIAAALVLAVAWFGVIAPEHKKEQAAAASLEGARAELVKVQQEATHVRETAARYRTAKRSDAALRVAVPDHAAQAALLDEIETASERHNIQFASISSGGTGGSAAGAGKAAPQIEGMSPTTYSFVFAGQFFEFERLMAHITALTHSTHHGTLLVGGRLLVIDSVRLTPESESSTKKASKHPKLTGTVEITAFQQGGGTTATPGSPAASTSTTSGASTAPPSGGTTP